MKIFFLTHSLCHLIASIDDSHHCDISMYDFPTLPVSHATDLTMDLITIIVLIMLKLLILILEHLI